MATEIIKTIKASGGDYSSLAAWDAGEARDLPSADEIAIAEVYDFVDTAAVNIGGGWTTDPTRYIHIRPGAGQGHQGKYDASKYVLQVTDWSGSLFQMDDGAEYSKIDGIQIEGILTTGSSFWYIFHPNALASTSNLLEVQKMIIKGTITAGVTGSVFGWRMDGTNWNFKAKNMIIQDIENGGSQTNYVGLYDSDVNSLFLAHITINNCRAGIRRVGADNPAASSKIRNVVSSNSSNLDFYDVYDPANIAWDYNAGDETQADIYGARSRKGSAGIPTYQDESGGDFTPASSDRNIRGRGVDLSGDSDLPVTDDIKGNPRPNAGKAVDIGAIERQDGTVLTT